MATVAHTGFRITDELAEFFASGPSRSDLIGFHPSPAVQERARELLHKLQEGELTADERRELDQFEYAERLMRLIKAKVHSANGSGHE